MKNINYIILFFVLLLAMGSCKSTKGISTEKRYLREARKGNVEAMNNLAAFYYYQDNYSKAEKYWLRAAEKGNIDALLNLGISNYEQGNFQEAEKYWLQSIEKGDVRAMRSLGVMYKKQGRTAEAEKLFLQAAEEGDATVACNLAYSYYEQGNYAEAEKYWLQAAENGDVISIYNLGTLALEQSNYAKAVEYLQRRIEINSDDASPYGNLSFSYIFTKDYKKSEQSALKGLSIDSTKTWIKTNLAAALLFQNRYEEAKNIYLKISEESCLDMSCAEMCLEDFGEYEKAGVIPKNQKENVEKIRQLLRSGN